MLSPILPCPASTTAGIPREDDGLALELSNLAAPSNRASSAAWPLLSSRLVSENDSIAGERPAEADDPEIVGGLVLLCLGRHGRWWLLLDVVSSCALARSDGRSSGRLEVMVCVMLGL